MNLKQISLKFLLSKKKYSYTNISLYLSIFSFSFAVAVTLIVISMSRGYRVEVENSLMSIEPDLIITQKSRNYIDPFYIEGKMSWLILIIYFSFYFIKNRISKKIVLNCGKVTNNTRIILLFYLL